MNGTRLTVLQLLPALESGGVERGVLEVTRALAAAGHRALVMSAGGGMVKAIEAAGGEHHTWPIGQKSLWTLRHIGPLRRFLLREQVDILHARSRMPAWVAWLAWRGMPPRRRPRFVTTAHGLYSVNRYSAVMMKGEAVIAVSETMRDYILHNYPDVAPERIHVIHRGVDAGEFPYGFKPDELWEKAVAAEYPEAAGKLRLLLPGRITRLKGHEDFLEIMRRLKKRGLPVHGLIVGGAAPSKRKYLQKLHYRTRALNLEKEVSFTGQRQDMKNIMAWSHLVLSLSTQPESFGRTTLEALRLGVPTAGYDHGGVGEILSRIYPSGLLPLSDIDAATRRIEALLKDTPPVPEGDFFPLQNMLDKTLALYTRLAYER